MIRRPKAVGRGNAMRRGWRAWYAGAIFSPIFGSTLGAIALFGLSTAGVHAQPNADGATD
ncbi:hypothetical protein BTK96_006981, partial [Burkholderia pyrrocinia]|nr:hypothetical protein [Burkholderia pyrrocinia]